MSISQTLLAEFEVQAPITRKFLERLPEDKLTWKPHHKSMSARQLAYHLAFVPGGVVRFVQNNDPVSRSLATAPMDDEPVSEEEAGEIAAARASLDRGEGITHEQVMAEFGLNSEDIRRLGRIPLDPQDADR